MFFLYDVNIIFCSLCQASYCFPLKRYAVLRRFVNKDLIFNSFDLL